MTTSARRRASKPISSARWVAYAAAGAASAIGTQAAEAGVIYSGILNAKTDNTARDEIGSTVPLGYGFLNLKLGSGASVAFFDSYSRSDDLGFGAFKFRVNPRVDGVTAMLGARFFAGSSYAYALKFAAGSELNSVPMINYPGYASLAFASGSSGSVYSTGQFVDRGVGYVGFKFDVGPGTQYGWARVENLSGGSAHKFRVIDYAFGNPAAALTVGQCGDGGELVTAASGHCNPADSKATGITPGGRGEIPEPGSLGLLAFGAAGLMYARRRKRHAGEAGLSA